MSDLKPKRMLVILAHPDDESFATGGTLAKYALQDVQVILLCATRGEAGIPGINPKEAGELRERELRKAAEHLGIDVHMLGYLDGKLASMDPRILLEMIASWIDLIKPQVIITFGPEGVSGHPDHITISHIVTQAYDEFYKKGILLYIRPSEATALGCGVTFTKQAIEQPLVAIDISDYKLAKIRAIQCHVSQNLDLVGTPEEEMDKIPCHELFTLARQATMKENYPEWFQSVREEEMSAVNEQT
jgi:LmbE family N-acetylglucosaminyl deacetylase